MFESFVFCVLIVTLIYCVFEQISPCGMSLPQASVSLLFWSTVVWLTGPVVATLLLLTCIDLICRRGRDHFLGSRWQLDRLATAHQLKRTVLCQSALYTDKALELASLTEEYLLTGNASLTIKLAKRVLELSDQKKPTEDQQRMLKKVEDFLRQCLREGE